MTEVLEHPEFVKDLACRAGDAVLALLQGDADLAGFFKKIVTAELEDLALTAAGDAPKLVVLIPETDSQVIANADTGQLRVVVELLMILSATEGEGTKHWLRQRIVAHIKRLVYSSAPGGRLSDVDGDITEGLTRFGRVPFLYRFANGIVATPIRIEWSLWEDLAAGDFV